MDVLQVFNDKILQTCKDKNITWLGFDGKYEINGKQIPLWRSNIIAKNRQKRINDCDPFDYWENDSDLDFCSQSLFYYVAQLYLYRPHLSNSLNNPILHP